MSQGAEKSQPPEVGIEPGPQDLKANTLPRRCKSRLLPQGSRSVLYTYLRHFYCLAVEAGFYSDVVECLPLDPAALVYKTLLLPCGRSQLLQRRGRVFAFRSCGPGSIPTSGGWDFSAPCDIWWPVCWVHGLCFGHHSAGNVPELQRGSD